MYVSVTCHVCSVVSVPFSLLSCSHSCRVCHPVVSVTLSYMSPCHVCHHVISVTPSDSRLPDTLSAQERRQQAVEVERTKKWLSMLSGRHEHKRNSRVYKGIPDRVRGRVWQQLLGVEDQLQQHAGLYKQLRRQARLWSPEARQIDLDVNRTFRDHIMFRERYGIKQQALFHVLGECRPAVGPG